MFSDGSIQIPGYPVWSAVIRCSDSYIFSSTLYLPHDPFVILVHVVYFDSASLLWHFRVPVIKHTGAFSNYFFKLFFILSLVIRWNVRFSLDNAIQIIMFPLEPHDTKFPLECTFFVENDEEYYWRGHTNTVCRQTQKHFSFLFFFKTFLFKHHYKMYFQQYSISTNLPIVVTKINDIYLAIPAKFLPHHHCFAAVTVVSTRIRKCFIFLFTPFLPLSPKEKKKPFGAHLDQSVVPF